MEWTKIDETGLLQNLDREISCVDFGTEAADNPVAKRRVEFVMKFGWRNFFGMAVAW